MRRLALFIALVCACSSTKSEPRPPTAEERAAFQQELRYAMQDAARRLKLTDGQKRKFRPLWHASLQERGAILERYRDEPRNRRTGRKLKNEMDAVGAKLDKQLAEFLTREQMDEYRVIVKELRKRIRDEFKQRQSTS